MLSGQTICVIAEATKTKPIAGNHQLVYPFCPESKTVVKVMGYSLNALTYRVGGIANS
jgi:hypothetical protein